MDLSELSSSTMLKAASIGNTLLIAGAVLHKDVPTAALLEEADTALWHMKRAGDDFALAEKAAARFENGGPVDKLLGLVALQACMRSAVEYRAIPLVESVAAVFKQSRHR